MRPPEKIKTQIGCPEPGLKSRHKTMNTITRNNEIITIGPLTIIVLPAPAPSLEQQAEMRRAGWIPRTVGFSASEMAEALERDIRNWQAIGWTLNLRQKNASLLKINLKNPPPATALEAAEQFAEMAEVWAEEQREEFE